jgi:hypothetical protein
MGQHTVENLGVMIATELWKENLVFTPGVEIRLFENGIERASTTLLAQLLKDNIRAFRGDGCTLEFECVTSGKFSLYAMYCALPGTGNRLNLVHSTLLYGIYNPGIV